MKKNNIWKFENEDYEIRKIGREEANDFLEIHHYAKNRPVSMYSLGVYQSCTLIGVISYGKSVSPTVFPSISDNLRQHEYMELLRLCILDVTPKNFESWFISKSIKMLKKAYPQVKILVSYADPFQGHTGSIYQATNWIYTGTGSTATYFINKSDGKFTHPQTMKKKRKKFGDSYLDSFDKIKMPAKHKYIFILHKTRNYYKNIENNSFIYEEELDYYLKLEQENNKIILERYNNHVKVYKRKIIDEIKLPITKYPKKIS